MFEGQEKQTQQMFIFANFILFFELSEAFLNYSSSPSLTSVLIIEFESKGFESEPDLRLTKQSDLKMVTKTISLFTLNNVCRSTCSKCQSLLAEQVTGKSFKRFKI